MKLKMERKCLRCQSVKPPRTHHCSVCGRCVMKMDHHCPWMNNCIGLRNMKQFVLFNFYVFICAFWTTLRLVIEGIICKKDKLCHNLWSGKMLGFIIPAGIICGLFAVFSLIMLCDSIKMIIYDTSTIDKKQLEKAGVGRLDEFKK